jgi:ribonuclease Z
LPGFLTRGPFLFGQKGNEFLPAVEESLPMKPLLHSRLLNGPFGDPALFIEILWEHRALLFDLGELGELRPAKLLKVSHVFVTHTHIDHFIGFDTLLRVMLRREKALKIFGPEGFLANVRGKLAGYTWNLATDYPLVIEAAEVLPDRILRQRFSCQGHFSPGEVKEKEFNGILEDEEPLQIQAVHLDHFIPSMAFALQERFHVNVHREKLTQMGLAVGPWIRAMKQAIWRGERGDTRLQVPLAGKGRRQSADFCLDRLRAAVTIAPGQKIAYVADCRFTEKDIHRIVRLAENADIFFCEAAFLDRDRDRAEERAHLTARQAGELARMAKAKKLQIFHFSPKYEKEGNLLEQEAAEAFRG